MAAPFEVGNSAAAGPHSFDQSDRREKLLEQLYDLAMHAEHDMTRVRASTTALDLLEGPQRSATQAEARDVRFVRIYSDQ